MTLHIRPAGPLDAGPMADLLNEIIRIGGTTAITTELTGDGLRDWMRGARGGVWHLAEDEQGTIMGFQWIEESDALPVDATSIATFARAGATGLGIGSALFDRTRQAAADAGYKWICAKIRADNTGGLAYYRSRGFEDYGRVRDVTLSDGTVVDQILTRFDL